MKPLLVVILIGIALIFSGFVYASDDYEAKRYAALIFAQDYAQEIMAKRQQSADVQEKENKVNYEDRRFCTEESAKWNFTTGIKIGVASYKEEELGIKSDFKAIYPEFYFSPEYLSNNDIYLSGDCSFGATSTNTETWYVDDIKYQTNDLDFLRSNFKVRTGKMFYLDDERNFSIAPIAGYGFRYIEFERTNFNILDIITLRDVVTEKYYIHHADAGVKFNIKLSDKFNLSGLGTYGYVFSDEADNSALGKIKGEGGYLVDANLNLGYSLNDAWQIIAGGFFEFQRLDGGTKGDIIWPDNKLDIYGGNIAVKWMF